MFRTSRVVPFKSKVSVMANLVARLKSLGQHPPVEELCRCVTERYNQLVSSLDRLYAATQTQGVKRQNTYLLQLCKFTNTKSNELVTIYYFMI